MPAANPQYDVIPRHTMFQIGRTFLPSRVPSSAPLIGIVKREGILEVTNPAGVNPPSRIVLLCQVANDGIEAFTLEVAQSANNNGAGVDGTLTPDPYAARPIRVDSAAVAGGTVLVQPGGRVVFLVEWDLGDDDYLRFIATAAQALAATGNVDLTGLPVSGEQVVISDGINPAITYQFGAGADTATLQHVAIGISAAITIASFIALVNTPTAGAIVGFTASAGAGDSMDLVQDVPGEAGNVLITENATNTTATGMSGGFEGVAPTGELTLAHYNGTLTIRQRETNP